MEKSQIGSEFIFETERFLKSDSNNTRWNTAIDGGNISEKKHAEPEAVFDLYRYFFRKSGEILKEGLDGLTMFLVRVLEKILRDKETRKSQNLTLKSACEDALANLKKENVNGKCLSTVLPDSVASIDCNRYFEPFDLAISTENSRLSEISLDTIQKLVAHGHLTGNCPDPRDENKLLVERIVRKVCDCFHGDKTPDNVQLQVLKALLTILTSQLVEVHTGSLLMAVKTCFNICLISKNVVNQTTARATLTQIVNLAFSKVEQEAMCQLAVTHNQLPGQLTLTTKPERSNHLANEEDEHSNIEIVNVVTSCMTEILLQLDSSSEGISGTDVEICIRDKTTSVLDKATIHQKDAFYILNSLCKISQRATFGQKDVGSRTPSTLDLRSKILSLQLILSILQNPGIVLRTDPIFLSLIQNEICFSLSDNAASNVLGLFELSLAIFIELVAHFKQHLKWQIEVFFKEILLTILDSPNSSFHHKAIVLQVLKAICSDRQILLDLYINYDCNLRCSNVIDRLVGELSRLAHGRHMSDLGCTTPVEESAFRRKGLECLVSILYCMSQWLQLTSNTNEHADNGNIMGETLSLNSVDVDLASPSAMEVLKRMKDKVECGIDIFNRKTTEGAKFLEENGLVDGSAESLAKFLHNYEDKLNKTAVGEFLGAGNKTSKAVMYAYVDQMNFVDIPFLTALRQFLSGFRLPGEAQKIDRLMEKFASRYCECNQKQDLFASADTAYVLAFSVIMLTTDLHSSQVKRKMTKEQYIRMNKGINESKDLPAEYLSKLYEEIANEEIKMRSYDREKINKFENQAPNEKNRRILFNLEMEHVQRIAKTMIETSGSTDIFMEATNAEHVRPMFKILWSPCLAAFSVGMQDAEDETITQLCLNGLSYAIFISGMSRLDTERNAFVQAMSRFTLLTSNSIEEVKTKNIACIRSLISMAFICGNYLGVSWLEVLRCVSQLECSNFAAILSKNKLNHPEIGRKTERSNSEHRKFEQMQMAVEQQAVVAIDRIFTNSVTFDGEAIVAFVRALCNMSSEELQQDPPRTFCLQKIIEISYYNMDRVRLQWARTWDIVADHFVKACTSSNVDVASFALDSLRQLSLKFLDKEELTNFHFQKDFLRPFEHTMRRNKFPGIRDMLIRCVMHMVNIQANKLKSGWKNIFNVLLLGAADPKKDIVELSFMCTKKIVSEMMVLYFPQMLESIQDCVKCLAEFSSNADSSVTASEALKLIVVCTNHIDSHPAAFQEQLGEEVVGVAIDDRIWVRGWLPVLFELHEVISRCRSDIRTQAISITFELLNSKGSSFKKQWWEEVITVVCRLFERSPDTMQLEWSTSTNSQLLHCLVELLSSEHFEILEDFLLAKLLDIMRDRLCTGHVEMARTVMRCFEKTLFSCCSRFATKHWEMVLKFVGDVLDVLEDTSYRITQQENEEEKSADGKFGEDPLKHLYLREEVVHCLIGTLQDHSQIEIETNYMKQVFQKCKDDQSNINHNVFAHLPNTRTIVSDSVSCDHRWMFANRLFKVDNLNDNEDGAIAVVRQINAMRVMLTVLEDGKYRNMVEVEYVGSCLWQTMVYIRMLATNEQCTHISDHRRIVDFDQLTTKLAGVLFNIFKIESTEVFNVIIRTAIDELCWSINDVATKWIFRFALSQTLIRHIHSIEAR